MNKNKLTKKRVSKIQTEMKDLLDRHDVTHGLGRGLRLFTKELIFYQNHLEGLKKWKLNKDKFSAEKIQIGGGKHILDGYLNIDISPPADLVCDVREGIPIGDESSNLIFSEHFFEHVDYPKSSKKVISEFFRILKQGGQVILGVPDSKMVIKGYVSKNKEYYYKALDIWYKNRNCLDNLNTYIDLVNYHFRDQDDDMKYSPHYWAYDFEKLESLFKNAGFNKVERWKFDPLIANPKREWGSIYVIATK